MTDEFYQIYKEKLISILHKFFQEIEKGQFPNSFFEARKTLKVSKDISTKKHYMSISLINKNVKNPQQNINKSNPAIHKIDNTP